MKKTIIVVLSLTALFLLYRFVQNEKMNILYNQATEFRGGVNPIESVRKLALYDNAHSNMLLSRIAMGSTKTSAFSSDAQVEAIRTLSRTSDPVIAGNLASLLQPHNGLDIRLAVALTLQHLPCKSICIESILHYLERVKAGELNLEDLATPSNVGADISFEHEHEQLYGILYSTLKREQSDTVATLRFVYGLESVSPTLFALDLLRQTKIPDACPLLLRSKQKISSRPPEFFHAPRQQLQDTINALNCN